MLCEEREDDLEGEEQRNWPRRPHLSADTEDIKVRDERPKRKPEDIPKRKSEGPDTSLRIK